MYKTTNTKKQNKCKTETRSFLFNHFSSITSLPSLLFNYFCSITFAPSLLLNHFFATTVFDHLFFNHVLYNHIFQSPLEKITFSLFQSRFPSTFSIVFQSFLNLYKSILVFCVCCVLWLVFFDVVCFWLVVLVWSGLFVLCLWFWLSLVVFFRVGCDLFRGVVVVFDVSFLSGVVVVFFVVCGVLSVNHICAPCLSVNHISAPSLTSPETWNHFCEPPSSITFFFEHISWITFFESPFLNHLFWNHFCESLFWNFFFFLTRFSTHFFDHFFRFSLFNLQSLLQKKNTFLLKSTFSIVLHILFLFVVFFGLCFFLEGAFFGDVFCRVGCDLFRVVVVFNASFLSGVVVVFFVVCGVLSVNHICAPCLSVNHICAPFPSPHLKLETWNQFCESFFDHFPITLFLRSLFFNHSFFAITLFARSLFLKSDLKNVWQKTNKSPPEKKNTDTNQPQTHTHTHNKTQEHNTYKKTKTTKTWAPAEKTPLLFKKT